MPIELVRGDIDHTTCARIVHHRVVIMGIESKTKTHEDTKAGRVYATSTCKVVIEATEPNIVMTSAEARELSRALSYAALLSDQHDKRRRGEFQMRVYVDGDGVATLEYQGSSMLMRKQVGMKKDRLWRDCDDCRKRIEGESWVSERVTDKGWGPKKRVGEYRLCLDCFPKHICERAAAPRLVK